MKPPAVFRWDLDKTYLVSHFESLRQLIRIPFQRAEDKVAVPGVAALIRALRRTADNHGRQPRVYFLSASPPQIGSAIRDKLELDGIAYDGITFKDQVRNLIRGRFDAVLEQIGYKLEQLLRSAQESAPGSRELLFGDDWESDPFIYSLYADILDGSVDRELAVELLESANVNKRCVARVAQFIATARPPITVEAVFILRQRPALAADLDAFGSRTMWFDNYFECALGLYAIAYLDGQGVLEVANAVGLTPSELAASFDAVDERGSVPREWLGAVRRVLVARGLMAPVAKGRLGGRLLAFCRRHGGLPPGRRVRRRRVPDYRALVERWSYRGSKEATHDEAQSRGGSDDRGGRA